MLHTADVCYSWCRLRRACPMKGCANAETWYNLFRPDVRGNAGGWNYGAVLLEESTCTGVRLHRVEHIRPFTFSCWARPLASNVAIERRDVEIFCACRLAVIAPESGDSNCVFG
jgi:hypothetical protein